MNEERAKALAGENLRLVHMCANKFKDKGIEYEELYSAGCLGLVKASKNFDESLGFAFSTYAVPVILGEIKRCFRDGGEVKVSRSMKEKARELLKLKEELERESGGSVGINSLAEKMGVSPSDIAELLGVSAPVISIDSASDIDGLGGKMEIPDKSFEAETVDRLTISEMLSSLAARDRRLIELRYFEEKTQGETGRCLGMTQVQVSRREKALLSLMRNRMCAF